MSIMDIQKKYLIGVDVGTTSQKVAVFDTDGNTLAAVNVDYVLETRGNTVEFDALEYISILRRGLTAAAWKAFPGAGEEELRERVAAISIDTQGETLIVTDGENRPLRPAIVWLDNRADAQAKAIDAHFGRERVYEVTGQPEIVATWPACKLAWLRENEPEVFSETERVFLLEDWLLWALSGRFVTEPTVQSSTIYFDIRRRAWWKEMLEEVGISERQLPRIVPSGTVRLCRCSVAVRRRRCGRACRWRNTGSYRCARSGRGCHRRGRCPRGYSQRDDGDDHDRFRTDGRHTAVRREQHRAVSPYI